MKKIKIVISKIIWRICKISPKWGNRIMDLIGYENYIKVSKYQKM